jgi:hypothetical protein
MQGKSLLPLLYNQDVKWRKEIFTEQLMDIQNYPRSESIRTEEWKYIRYFKRTEDPVQDGKYCRGTLDNYIKCLSSPFAGEEPVFEELFNLREDPRENINLAGTRTYQNILNEFRIRINKAGSKLLPANKIPLTVPMED